jgi:hypothetical protein
MNYRKTWLWVSVAVALFAFIYLREHYFKKPPVGPTRVLQNFRAIEVNSIKVQLPGQQFIRVDRTNGSWQLSAPINYPAHAVRIDTLLRDLERLSPAATIDSRDMGERSREEDFGLSPEQASLIFQFPGHQTRLQVGYPTAPGDQVFLQTTPGSVMVADAAILKLIPKNADDWRDTALIRFQPPQVDGLAITNPSVSFEMIRDQTNGLWRIAPPFQVRADNTKIDELLRSLQKLSILQFYSDQTNIDLEPLGLQPPQLQIALRQGTNQSALLQFGKSPTNDAKRVFARRAGQLGVVTVSADLLEPWKASVNDFRDQHLVVLTDPVNVIEVRGEDTFSLVYATNATSTNATWRIQPQDVPADPDLVHDLLTRLVGLQVAGMAGFVKDVVAEPTLPEFGLAPPARKYLLKSSVNSSNTVLEELDFGKIHDDKIYARRIEESSVYDVRLSDYTNLPSASWQLRNRQVWTRDENDLARLVVHQQGQVREIIRNGDADWKLAPGSQGIIEPGPVEETARGLCHLSAQKWIVASEKDRGQLGFTNDSHSVTLEFKNGDKAMVEFGGDAPDGLRYAATTLEGKWMVFEMPPLLYRDVDSYLSIR